MVVGNIRECAYQLFIFDEVDEMPPGILDELVPFMDYLDKVDGLDHRKAVYLILG